METKNKLMFLLLISGASLFLACSKDKDETTSASTTQFNVRMTDAIAAYDSVNIDIIAVEVKTSGGGTVMLNVNPGVYNLLDYANGVDTLIATATIPTATVSQVRLILGPNNSVVVSGVRYPLNTPSAQESGLKLQVHTELQPGIAYTMLLDFDANRSIVTTGSGSYQLKPVIRVITQAANGSIHGIVSPLTALPATVYAIMGNDTVTTTTDATGSFLFQGMTTGSYSIVVLPQPPFTVNTTANVNVSVGILTEVGTIIVI